jgi:hypothetical protein
MDAAISAGSTAAAISSAHSHLSQATGRSTLDWQAAGLSRGCKTLQPKLVGKLYTSTVTLNSALVNLLIRHESLWRYEYC